MYDSNDTDFKRASNQCETSTTRAHKSLYHVLDSDVMLSGVK